MADPDPTVIFKLHLYSDIMNRRVPSVSSSLCSTDRSSIRRRSGKLSPEPDECDSEHGSPRLSSSLVRYNSLDWAAQVEEYDSFKRRPTVVLVKPLQDDYRHPSGPWISTQSTHPLLSAASESESSLVLDDCSANDTIDSPNEHLDPDFLSPVHLTPRIEVGGGCESKESLISLPTPDFTLVRNRSFRSILPRRPSFLSFGRPNRLASSAFVMVTPPQRPQSVRTESTYSSTSSNSASGTGYQSTYPCATNSTDHQLANINNKFTSKWPRPHCFRESSGSRSIASSNSLNQIDTALLEKGLKHSTIGLDCWTMHKWCLLLSLITVFAYGLACLSCAIMTWVRIWGVADVVNTADSDILILATLTGSILIFASCTGMVGFILNSRQTLAIYTVVLWPALITMLSVGYLAYRRSTFALDRKLDLAWSQWYTPEGRLLIQNSLGCCGYYDTLHDAVFSKRCHARAPLPGCRGKLYRFEKANLGIIWGAAFSFVPLHIVNIVVALLCANHVTKRFGQGITPKGYRLTPNDLRADAKKIMLNIDKAIPPTDRTVSLDSSSTKTLT